MSYSQRVMEAPVSSPGVAVEWEEAGCLLCASRRWLPLVEAQDPAPVGPGLYFAVVQCQGCGLCFTNPRPSEASTAQFYPTARAGASSGRRSLTDRWPWLHDWLSRRQPPGRLLDFGGGSAFHERMRRLGWSVTGINVSAATAGRFRVDGSLQVAGTLPQPELVPGSFDVITLRHTLEHAHQPREVLTEAYRLLTDGGKLLVVVPNIDSAAYRWFHGDWVGLDVPRHLTHFAPMTLSLMLERVGFRIGDVRMPSHSKWLRQSARRVGDQRRHPYWHRWLATRLGARLASWYASLTRQGDCLVATAFK
jgi:SAM-dependent methyltransferase